MSPVKSKILKNDHDAAPHAPTVEPVESEEEVQLTEIEQAYATLQARKLAYFVGTLDTSDDMKKNLLMIAESMDLETLERFISWLEGNYVEFNLRWLNVPFEEEMGRIREKYDRKKDRLAKTAVADLNKLTEKVKHQGITSRLRSEQ